jgi:hypothetical protein
LKLMKFSDPILPPIDTSTRARDIGATVGVSPSAGQPLKR